MNNLLQKTNNKLKIKIPSYSEKNRIKKDKIYKLDKKIINVLIIQDKKDYDYDSYIKRNI